MTRVNDSMRSCITGLKYVKRIPYETQFKNSWQWWKAENLLVFTVEKRNFHFDNLKRHCTVKTLNLISNKLENVRHMNVLKYKIIYGNRKYILFMSQKVIKIVSIFGAINYFCIRFLAINEDWRIAATFTLFLHFEV